MKNDDLDAMLAVAQEAVDIGRKLMLTNSPGEIHAKGDRDFVTDLDLRIQREIRSFLAHSTPDVQFLGEEDGGGALDPNVTYVWALDPIDGTSNFAHGIPLCATQLALVQRGEPVVGIIAAPLINLTYHAVIGSGAYCNDRRIQASTNTDLARSIVSIGDYATGQRAEEKNRHRFAITHALTKSVERIRMFGTAAIDLAFVAEGRTDACIILSNKPWDTAAGALISTESGTVTTDSRGLRHDFGSDSIVAAASGIHADLIDQILATYR